MYCEKDSNSSFSVFSNFCVVLYINSYVSKQKIENKTYIKQFILIFVIVYFIHYMNNKSDYQMNQTTIHTGNPTF